MIVHLEDLLAKLPGAPRGAWKDGVPFTEAFRHGTMTTELFALRGEDYQGPHDQDELYFVHEGTALFVHEGRVESVKRGSAIFVPAGHRHHFERASADFAAWVVFWGPKGGEPERAP